MKDENVSKLHCSPYNHVKYAETDGTCFSLKDLRNIAREYNKLSNNKIDLKKSKSELYHSLENAFKGVCKTELCWVQNKLIRNTSIKHTLKKAFRPSKPLEWYDNRETWLNTYDILLVMEQYEKLYKNFKFLGVFPIDFAAHNSSGRCIGDILCDFNIKDLISKRKKQFAMVLNLDRHNEPGSHWVSLYCNLNPKRPNFGIYFYDSVANSPPNEVRTMMQQVKEQVNIEVNSNDATMFQVKSNNIQKQFKNNECGMFSLIFLTQCLKQVPFDFICQHMKTDDEINRLRDVIYSPSK